MCVLEAIREDPVLRFTIIAVAIAMISSAIVIAIEGPSAIMKIVTSLVGGALGGLFVLALRLAFSR